MKPVVLVTGGAGYIGSHCCNALSEAGFLPVSYDNLSTGHPEFVKWGPVVVGDVRDKRRVADAVKRYSACAVMHFAAASLVGESMRDPQKYYSTNVLGSISLLEGMRESGCRRIVFSSSGAVYGDAGGGCRSECLPCKPVNPYGRSKLMIEQL